MSGFKKVISVVTLFALLASTAACSTGAVPPSSAAAMTTSAATITLISLTPSAAAAAVPASPQPIETTVAPGKITTTPSPSPENTDSGDDGQDSKPIPHYDIPDLAKLGISDAQYQKINALLYGVLNTHIQFQMPTSLSRNNLLCFVYNILDSEPEAIGINRNFPDGIISSDTVANLIRSAFSVKFTPRINDSFDDNRLYYKNGKYMFEGASGDPVQIAKTYSITRISSNRLLLKYNVIRSFAVGDYYLCKGQAVVQEDKSSLFGYHFISMSNGEEKRIKFCSASASSNLPANDAKTFQPKNAIDGKDSTAWAISNGKGEWIMLKFNVPEDLTGLSLYFGDWTTNETGMNSNQPSQFRFDFSDGTSIIESDENFELNYPCIAFGKKIKTSFVKITILDMDTDTAAYLSEVSPF